MAKQTKDVFEMMVDDAITNVVNELNGAPPTRGPQAADRAADYYRVAVALCGSHDAALARAHKNSGVYVSNSGLFNSMVARLTCPSPKATLSKHVTSLCKGAHLATRLGLVNGELLGDTAHTHKLSAVSVDELEMVLRDEEDKARSKGWGKCLDGALKEDFLSVLNRKEKTAEQLMEAISKAISKAQQHPAIDDARIMSYLAEQMRGLRDDVPAEQAA